MESRLQVMLQAVQTVRPALDRFYQSLSDEQKARFNAVVAGEQFAPPAKTSGTSASSATSARPG